MTWPQTCLLASCPPPLPTSAPLPPHLAFPPIPLSSLVTEKPPSTQLSTPLGGVDDGLKYALRQAHAHIYISLYISFSLFLFPWPSCNRSIPLTLTLRPGLASGGLFPAQAPFIPDICPGKTDILAFQCFIQDITGSSSRIPEQDESWPGLAWLAVAVVVWWLAGHGSGSIRLSLAHLAPSCPASQPPGLT